jgi:hypothetical protein
VNKWPGGAVDVEATLVYYDSPGQIEHYWRVLKRGFWHVAVCLPIYVDGEVAGHMIVNPAMPLVQAALATQPLVEVFPGATFQYVKIRRSLGDPPYAILIWATCTSIAKAFLGIRAPLVWTPYQLFKYILRNHPE